ncbi:antibiotic biosynthesis monooxygenase [Pinirhizobacter sp.]|jgi:heme-degrading monooxygenase HmoA|uniref:antibiotic biosynthesis monooxygenase family protein n=1 Tax=Pinirhizobacter sp. TaxID=2950432 RepID=UPI002F42D363
MFSVIFEVHPGSGQWDDYLGNARLLRPELEKIDGFIDNIRYGSLTREGWILSLSGWRDEKALVRWRTKAVHHDVQQKGRDAILSDYHLRVGQIVTDTHVPEGQKLTEQRLDETEAGQGTTVTLVSGRHGAGWVKKVGADGVAAWLGFDAHAKGLLDWDVFDAVLTPGEVILLLSWKTRDDAAAFEESCSIDEAIRTRRVRVVRDYGMFDRREAPQYYPDAQGQPTKHS